MKLQRFVTKHNHQFLLLNGILMVLGLSFNFWTDQRTIAVILLIAASIIGVFPIALHAFSALRYKTISIELLVTIAVIGAFVVGEFHESAIVTFLFLFGGYLEKKTLAKTRASIKTLTELAPTTATVKTAQGEKQVAVDDLAVADQVLVKPGDQIPVDGVIIQGQGYVNEAAITGESKPVFKATTTQVYSGSLLDSGMLTVRTEKVGDETTFGKIIELVEEAQDAKSPAEKFIDRFAKFYTPAVLVIALVVYLITRDLNTAITLLVLGCPGALVIGAPVSNVAGIGSSAKAGILVKGGEVTTALAHVDTVLFDKTGTLTVGKPEVVTTINLIDDAEKLKQTTAQLLAIEKTSKHPLAQAIVTDLMHKKIPNISLKDSPETVKGQGLVTDTLFVGNQRLLADHGIQLDAKEKLTVQQIQQQGLSTVLVADKQHLLLALGIGDALKPDTAAALSKLKAMGLNRLIMLTGDNAASAQAIGQQLPLSGIQAELLPEDKLAYIKAQQAEGHQVAFVGDGINDSPALAAANVGIAMGAGADAAIETADVTLMNANFMALVVAIQKSRQTHANTVQNIVIAIGTVAALLIGLLLGKIDMASGMFVHEASILVVIFNAMRLLRHSNLAKRIQTAKKIAVQR
ncbi:heavy metal translocating P-type ATPase [Agrilactobacillus fermenti]|uniref:heavy metal translocating P-type ATPase n=1 Tax=Agrilactobacillus fermenti TaxID=2586909 RepID=UPI003A5C0B6F